MFNYSLDDLENDSLLVYETYWGVRFAFVCDSDVRVGVVLMLIRLKKMQNYA